ncbi:MAG: hypothetical protein KatS3mg035_1589 [Bacteroidia bacterium]|nr:MAG: hypothetical protein KatS3mg035_1589 [Bacteroidia bacterium]
MIKRIKYFFLFITVVSLGLVWYFTTTPYYTLIRTFYAIKSNNVETFQYYCDVDSLSESLIDEILYLKTEDLPKDLSVTIQMMQADKSRNAFFKKLLAKGIKTQILKAIKQNKWEENPNKKTEVGSIASLENVLRGENHTVIKLDVKTKGEVLPLHFRLRKLEGHWKLVGIEQFGKLLIRVIQSQNAKR